MNLSTPLIGSYPITQTFTEHVQAAKANNWTSYNGGIDWGCPMGTPVYAAADGVVEKCGIDPCGYGNFIRLRHADGYQTIYAHLSVVVVNNYSSVKAGKMIGRSGTSGNSTGPHLHFELRKDGKPVDPQPLLDGQDTPEPAPDVTSIDIPAIPKLPQVRVTADELNIRVLPNVNSLIVGQLIQGNDPHVMAVKQIGDDIWLQIGWQQWAAMRYGGNVYMEWVA